MTIDNRIRRVLGDGAAQTRPDAADPRFRGRTYAIPFDDVWRASLDIVQRELRGCSLRLSNDRDGIIIAECPVRFPRRVDDVTVSITLDEDAQTRVDMRSLSREGKSDLGANTRRVARFFELLDERMTQLARSRLARASNERS